MVKSKELSVSVRGIIVGRMQEGANAIDLAQEYNVHKSIIYRIVKHWKKAGTCENKHRSGCPEILSEREKRCIIKDVLKKPRITLGELADNNQLNVSEDTIQRVLTSRNLYSHIPAHKPYLTTEQEKVRLIWCKIRQNWTKVKWREIIFSDESTFELRKESYNIYI